VGPELARCVHNEALRKKNAPAGVFTIDFNDKTDAVNFEKGHKTQLRAQPKTHISIIILLPSLSLQIFFAQFTYMPGSVPTTAPSQPHRTHTSNSGYLEKSKTNKHTCQNTGKQLILNQAAHCVQNTYLLGFIHTSGAQFMHSPWIPFEPAKQPLQ